MKTNCPDCSSDNFRVIKTYPCEDHTLRHLKCRACGANRYTHEYVLSSEEYTWKNKRLVLTDESLHKREELAWKAFRLLLNKK